MARTIYASGPGDAFAAIGVDGDYELPAAATYEVWTADYAAGGSHHTDLLTLAGAPITVVTPDPADGRGRFQGVDGYEGEYWLKDAALAVDSPRYRVHPDGMAERIKALEDAAGGVGVTDGNKGDITVSSSGTVWNIDANTVGNTEAADMAESTIKGRAAAAGTGDPTDLTATQVRTVLNVANGATANSADATLVARSSHTGTQSADTLTDGTTNKAFLATERTTLAALAAEGVVNTTEDQTVDGVKTFVVAPIVPNNSWTISDTGGLTGTLYTKQSLVLWNAGTNTWGARPTAGDAPFVVFWSTNDVDATPPDDVNLVLGDAWKRHPDAPPL